MDPEKIRKLGTSLAVPSVQEMAKQGITEVPERYIRPNQDTTVPYHTISLLQIPVIDLSNLLSQDATELDKLDRACKEWGFFQLINHGVNPSLVEDMKKNVEEFFNLPMEEKKELCQKAGELEGFGQIFVVSEEHKLEWADVFYILLLPLSTRNPHLFPRIPQQFRENIEKYSLEVKKLCDTVLVFMTKALKIEPNELLDFFEEGAQSMRMNYYPPCPQPEQVIGLSPHSDGTALTILLQVNEIEGLQIRKDGMWIPVKPLPNAFIINVGDMLEIMTNGIYRSIEHRATVNSEMERISIAAFHSPKLNTDIGPAKSLITSERPAAFKSINDLDFYKVYSSRQLQGKSQIDVLRIQNE